MQCVDGGDRSDADTREHATVFALPWWPPAWLLLWRSERDDNRRMTPGQVMAQKVVWVAVLVVMVVSIIATVFEVFPGACPDPCFLAPS